MKSVLTAIFVAGLLIVYVLDQGFSIPGLSFEPETGNQRLEQAFENQQSGVQVQGQGRVIKLLRDDLDGSRHQRFILELSSGMTLLVAHNIDLAPAIRSLETGDSVEFSGEYEWNSKGGVLHWTHHDPAGRHEGGWLKHEGRVYQ